MYMPQAAILRQIYTCLCTTYIQTANCFTVYGKFFVWAPLNLNLHRTYIQTALLNLNRALRATDSA